MKRLRILALLVLLIGVAVSPWAATFDPSGGGGAPIGATYITQTSHATLTAEQALGALSSGCLSVTTTTGVVASSGSACVLSSTTITIAGTANEITSSAGAQDLSANRTWTLSIPTVLDLSTKVLSGASPLVFEGLTANDFETTVAVTDPTADRTFTIPNADSVAAQPLTCGGTDKFSALSAAGVFTCTADSGGGGASLDAITAAVANQAGIANANFNIRWNWAKTTNTENAFMFGESTAATGGTSTSGVPNQVLLRLATLAASTMSPLRVDSRGSHVFSVSPSTVQIVTADGTNTAPIIAPATDTTTGLYFTSTSVRASITGTNRYILTTSQFYIPAGTQFSPGLVDITSQTAGIFWPSSDVVGIGHSSDGEMVRFLSRTFQVSRGSADAIAYAINFRKSRNTVNSPTVITTGDDGGTINFDFYVGATNTYQRGAYILGDSGGTISDSATGVGGIISLWTAIVGAEPAERMRIDNVGHVAYSGTTPSMGTCGTGPSVAGNDMAMLVTVGTAMGTACTVNFAQTWLTNAPVCHVQSDTDIVGIKVVASTTAVTATATLAFTDSSNLDIICLGRV